MTPTPTHPTRPASPTSRQPAGQRITGQAPADPCAGELRRAPGPVARPPRLTRHTVTVLRALHLDPAAPHDLRYLSVHTGLPRPTIRSILHRLTRCHWTSVEQDPHDAGRAHPRHLYRLTEFGAKAAGHLKLDRTVAVFRWDDPRSPRIVANDVDLDAVLLATATHGLPSAEPGAPSSAPWPIVEVTIGLSGTPTLWYATTRHRGVLLCHDPATGTILAAHHPNVPAPPQPITFTTPDGQPRALDPAYTRLRAHDVRTALRHWWRTSHPPTTLTWTPTSLRIPPCRR
jgi:hypothetical protein